MDLTLICLPVLKLFYQRNSKSTSLIILALFTKFLCLQLMKFTWYQNGAGAFDFYTPRLRKLEREFPFMSPYLVCQLHWQKQSDSKYLTKLDFVRITYLWKPLLINQKFNKSIFLYKTASSAYLIFSLFFRPKHFIPKTFRKLSFLSTPWLKLSPLLKLLENV